LGIRNTILYGLYSFIEDNIPEILSKYPDPEDRVLEELCKKFPDSSPDHNAFYYIDKERIRVLREAFAKESGSTVDDDDFLLELVKVFQNRGDTFDNLEISPTNRQIDALGMDQDRGAFQQLADYANDRVMRQVSLHRENPTPLEFFIPREITGTIPEGKIPFPPNLTNGYLVKLPYLDSAEKIQYVDLLVISGINRVNPEIFPRAKDFETKPKRQVVMTVNDNGLLEPVKSKNS